MSRIHFSPRSASAVFHGAGRFSSTFEIVVNEVAVCTLIGR
jgi:hypothetical protein